MIQKHKRKIFSAAAAVLLACGTAWTVGAADKEAAPKSHQVRELLPLIRLPAQQNHQEYWYDAEVQAGDSLAGVLERLGVSAGNIDQVLRQSALGRDVLQLREGQIVSVRLDNARNVTAIQFFHDDDNGEYSLIAIEKPEGKDWQIHAAEADTETIAALRSVEIKTSAAGALSRAGVPVEVRTALKEMFADKFNLDDLKEGDHIGILFETLYYRGQEIGTGNILAAEVQSSGKTYRGYYFEDSNGEGNFYDENGRSLTKGFAGYPIEHFSRISSPYGIRIHPVTHTVKMHTGVDYAAAEGTKILAPADGTVTFRGWKGGYGNTVMITHSNGVETLYGHMSAFVDGVQPGSRVRAGQTIGFVGSTGQSTGPHLHYEVRVGGQHVNPAAIALPKPKLNAQNLAGLQKYRQAGDSKLALVRGLPGIVAAD